MYLPLTLDYQPSKQLQYMLIGGYILAGVAIFILPCALFIRVLCGLTLVLILVLHLHHARSNRGQLILGKDGRLTWSGLETERYELLRETVVLPWMVVLHCQNLTQKRSMVVMRDSFDDLESHRRLRVWLKWRNTASIATNELNDDVAE